MTSTNNSEEIIIELDEQNNHRTNDLLWDFSSVIRSFLHKHKGNSEAIECFKKIAQIRDVFLAKHVINGTMDDLELEAFLAELKSYLDRFGA